MSDSKKFMFLASYPESLHNFRGNLIAELISKGFEVHLAAPNLTNDSATGMKLTNLGAKLHELPMNRTGINPIADILTCWRLFHLLRRVAPYYLFCYTIKPVVYGNVMGWLARIPRRYSLITGLGYAFTDGRGRRRNGTRQLLNVLYRYSLSLSSGILFQNSDDRALFYKLGIIDVLRSKSTVVNGSGVDLDAFSPVPMPKKVSFLMIARLQVDKGVREYVNAAVLVNKKFPNTQFGLAGWIDDRPDAIANSELSKWIDDGIIHYYGRLDDVREALAESCVYVLPSYREGTPRTVLEAMAMGRPIITTNAPGSRETVLHGDNGFLVSVGSVDELADAMLSFLQKPNLVGPMGIRSRELAEKKYDVNEVNSTMLTWMGVR